MHAGFENSRRSCKAKHVLTGSNKTPEEAIKQLNSEYQIYKSVESQLLHKKTRLMTKVPDLHRALDMVLLLIEKQGQEVNTTHHLPRYPV